MVNSVSYAVGKIMVQVTATSMGLHYTEDDEHSIINTAWH